MNNIREFELRCDLINIVDKMSDEQAGMLLKGILAYVNKQDIALTDTVTDLAFLVVRRDLDDFLNKKTILLKKCSDGGIKSGEKRRKRPKTLIEPKGVQGG